MKLLPVTGAQWVGCSGGFFLLAGIGLFTCVETENPAVSPIIYYENTTIRQSSGSRHALSRLRSLISKKDSCEPSIPITLDYPFNKSIFPPEIVSPVFLWHDTSKATAWMVEVRFDSSTMHLYTLVDGNRPEPSPPDSTCSRKNNHWEESAYQKSAHGWTPDSSLWTVIKEKSIAGSAHIDFYGVWENVRKGSPIISRGTLTLQTSRDSVGAPIFYRDVPLMPARNTDGVIQPLSQADIPSIAWRLRDIAKPSAPVVMKQMPTCINCHSFSGDGRTLGMDMDGPRGDKGAYTLVATAKQIVVQHEDVFSWNRFNPKKSTFGMFSQVSPDGRYVVSSVNEEVHVVNYTDFRFLQTFYPTRGSIAWFDRVADTIKTLRGADDPHYVQCNPVWSPDGKWVAFLRATARNAFGDGPKATSANDPRETQIHYDLYRIPFNGGNGGKPEAINGASSTGKSVSFPKYSPDGKWIVFVKAANGLLMRPDSKLFIIPADGGAARDLASNLPLMNSWHSWSPNSKWMVFSSKFFSPFTQMFLTHIDEAGNASPAILIPNSTASNRAVNIPEFVNLARDGIESIRTPATDYRIRFDLSGDFLDRGFADSAHGEIMKAIGLRPDYAPSYSMLAIILAKQDRLGDAMKASLKAVENAPTNNWVHLDAGMFLYALKRIPEAIEHLAVAVEYNPESARAHYFYGLAFEADKQPEKALVQYNEALRCDPDYADAYNNRGLIHFNASRTDMAIADCSRAIGIEPKASYFRNRAIAYLSMHDSDLAIRDLDSAARLEPTDGTTWYIRGNILLQKNETETAIVSFDKALAAEKTCLKALEPFCNVLFSMDRHAMATKRLSTMIARDPRNARLFNWRGLANMYQEQFGKAIADFDLVIAKEPTEASAFFYKALCCEAQGLRDAAAENFSLSIKFGDPKSEHYSIARQRINNLNLNSAVGRE